MPLTIRLILIVLAAAVLIGIVVSSIRRNRRMDALEYPEPKRISPPKKDTPDLDDLVVISVMAQPGKTFSSYPLLQAISAAGFEFGDLGIFHYRDKNSGDKLFSLASAAKPGDFDIDRFGEFSCPGLTIFMDAGAVFDSLVAFQHLLDAADHLVDDLDGKLCLGQKEALTDEMIDDYFEFLAAKYVS
jgi:FtsZ-interacting cell division protein ZipA